MPAPAAAPIAAPAAGRPVASPTAVPSAPPTTPPPTAPAVVLFIPWQPAHVARSRPPMIQFLFMFLLMPGNLRPERNTSGTAYARLQRDGQDQDHQAAFSHSPGRSTMAR